MGLFDDLTPGNAGSFADLIPKPKPRGLLGFANDTVISAANQIAGGVGSIANAVVPGNRFSQFIDEDIIKAGEAKQSDIVRQSRERFQAELENAEGGWDEAKAVGRYVADNPLQVLAQAAGALALVGLPVRGFANLAAGMHLGAGATNAAAAATGTRVATAAGSVMGGLMSGGDAAGTAYELVQKTPAEILMQSPQAQELASAGLDEKAIRDELGTRAARAAMPIPTLIGAGSGLIGAERILAGGKPLAGGALARGAQTALVEGGGEFLDEAATQYFGQKGAAEYNPAIDPTKGVVGAGLLGMALGAPTGGVVGALSPGRDQVPPNLPEPDPVAKVLGAGSIDEAIKAATEATTTPALAWNQRWEPEGGFAGQAPLYVFPDGSAATRDEAADVLAAAAAQRNIDAWVARSPRPMPKEEAQALADAAQERTGKAMSTLPLPDGKGWTVVPSAWVNHPSVAAYIEQASAAVDVETARQARIAEVAAAPVDRAPRTGSPEGIPVDLSAPNAVEQFVESQRRVNTPAARAFVQEFRAGRITSDDVMDLLVPSRLDPTPDARLAAAAAQAPKSPEGFLLTSDGFPYGSRIGAQARANKEGGEVVRVDGGFAVKVAEPAPATPAPAAAPTAPPAVSTKFDPQGLKPGTAEYEAAFQAWTEQRTADKAAANNQRQRDENQTALEKRNAWRKRVRDWFLSASDGDTITDTGTGTTYKVVVKKRANGQTIKSLVAVDENGMPLSDGRAATGIGSVDERVDGLDDASLDQETGSTTPETAGASLAASLGMLLESGDALTSSPSRPAAPAAPPAVDQAPPPVAAPASQGFDSAAWDKAREDRIKASKATGAKHLDDIEPYVETMRGKRVRYVHDPKVTGVVRTVDNRGNVYVNWSDDYSAQKEGASPMQDGKKTVMQTSLGPRDLKDYVVDEAPAPAAPKATKAKAPKPAADPADPNAPQLLRKATNPERMSERLREVAFRKLPEQVGTENVYLQDGAQGAGFYRVPKGWKAEAPKPTAPPAPLYASRPVTNAADIMAWAASQGFKSTLPADDLHVTVAYSREPVASDAVPSDAPTLTIRGGKRTVEPLGDEGAVVLKFTSPDMQARWKQYRDAGASWDYDSYTPHVTITYDGKGVDLAKVEPYTGPIMLGAEKQEALNVDKADDYKGNEAPAAAPEASAAPAPAPRKSLQESRTDAALDKEVLDNGERMTRRQWVERKVAEGLTTRVTQEDRIKPMSRMQFFRANNEEQRAHERRIKEGGKKDVFWIGDYEVTKSEHDYAQRLAQQPPADAPAADAPAPQVEPVATHKDPGEPAEPVTTAVVEEAIATAAENRDRPIRDVKADALRLIDAAIEKAPSSANIDTTIGVGAVHTDRGKKVMTGSRGFGEGVSVVVEARETRDGKWSVTDESYDGSGRTALGELAGTPAVAREQLMSLLRRLREDGTVAEPDLVTIRIPGDGEFKVENTKERLTAFRKRIEASPGFKAQRPGPVEAERVNGSSGRYNERAGERFGVEEGSGSKLAAFDNMVNEGDLEAASDYADATGLVLDPKKIANATKVLKWRETRPESVPVEELATEQEPAPTDVAAQEDEAPQLTEEQARKQFEWRDMGQSGGTKTHRLFFYLKPEDKGTGSAMGRGYVELYEGSSGWRVDGEGESYKALADAKKAAIEAAIPVLREQGWIAPDAADPKAEEKQAEAEEAPMPYVPGIPREVAQRAHAGTSHVPEVRAGQEQASFMGQLADAWDRAARAAGTDEAARARITEVFTDVAEGYRARYLRTLEARGRVMSSMITGPARFPVERNGKRMETERKRADEADQFLARGIKRLLRAARGPIDNSPEAELESVRLRLAEREDLQESMKAANAALRKGDDAALEDLGFTPEQIADLKKPDFAGRKGFPDYRIANNNAEIRRLRERLASAEERMQDAAAGPVETERAGVKMVEDATDDRLRLIFDRKPSEEVRNDLKANGFKWSPKNEAWQRQLTDNARYAAKQVLDKHFPVDDTSTPETRAETGNVPRLAGFDRFGEGPVSLDLAKRQVDGLLGHSLNWTIEEDATLGPSTPAAYDRATGKVLVNPAFVPFMTQGQMVGVLVEEFLHGVDSLNAKRALSAGSARLAVGGDIRTEVETNRSADGVYDEFLKYPLDDQRMSLPRIQAELLARLPVLYFADPAKFRRVFPTTYEALHGVFGYEFDDVLGSDGRLRDRAWRRAVDEPNAQDGLQLRLQPLARARLAQRVDGRPADRKLGQLRAGLAQALEADPRGTLLGGSVAPSQADSPLSRAPGARKALDRAVAAKADFDAYDRKAQRVDDADAYFALAKKVTDAKDALAAELLKAPDDGFALQGRTKNGRMVIVNGSAQNPGQWQITRFDGNDEPWGDSQYRTKESAVTDFLREIDMTSLENIDGALSRAPGARGRVSVRDARAVVDALRTAFPKAPQVRVLEKVNQAPRALLEDIRAAGAEFDVEAAFHKGEIYVFPGHVENLERLKFVVTKHEIRHAGFRGLLGDGMDRTMLALYEANASVRKAADAKIAARLAGSKAEAVDEALADMTPEDIAAMTGARPLLAKLRLALRRLAGRLRAMGWTTVADAITPSGWSDADVVALVLKAESMALRGQTDGTRFSRAPAVLSEAFQRWFAGSKVVDEDGQPLVVYHGTASDFSEFKTSKYENGIYFTPSLPYAEGRGRVAALMARGREAGGENVMPVYLRMENPAPAGYGVDRAKAEGFDGLVRGNGNMKEYVVFRPEQIKSAIGNAGTYDRTNPDIRYSRSISAAMAEGLNNVRDVSLPAGYKVADLLDSHGKISAWDKTVGTPFNLAKRHPGTFGKVYDRVQQFLNDISYHATEAADLAPSILPKLESLKDITKSPLSAADTKAIAAPIFEGTLTWTRDRMGKPISMEVAESRAEAMTVDEKASELLQAARIDPKVLRMWQGMPIDQYEAAVTTRYANEMLRPGVVWTDAELKRMFKLGDAQIKLYRQFRASIDRSLDDLTKSEMIRMGGKDVAGMADALQAMSVTEARNAIADRLREVAETDDGRAKALDKAAQAVADLGTKAADLKARGYAPLTRFGSYTLDVVDNGERVYFGMFESQYEANRMQRKMREQFPRATIQQGTQDTEAFKMFAGISPETIELFGEILGLDSTGDEASDKAFQTFLQKARSTRSAMKRLIHRKGIDGFSEDAGRVLAGFLTSNARRTSSNMHLKGILDAVEQIPKQQGELKTYAAKMVDYVQNPVEEAAALRGVLFAQYLGGSIASALVNMSQPIMVSVPYLSQYGGAKQAAAAMVRAMKDMASGAKLEPALAKALKAAEEDGVVAPQEMHQLQAQARGQAALRSGDGTKVGDAAAIASNTLSRASLAWGKLFGFAELVNRRSTYIAAYRVGRAQGMADPDAFARQAVVETQFTYNKGNRPQWARGAIGATLFTFKTYSVSYVELLSRMAKSGPDGRRAALLAVALLLLMSGADGLPFMEDAEDVLDAFMQRIMGRNWSTKQKRNELLAEILGKDAGQFLQNGVSGIPGVPIDVSGRMGMGNLIPGTALLRKDSNPERDTKEILGPAADLVERGFRGAGMALQGDFGRAALEVSPVAARNVAKGVDMIETGTYRDAKGRKVIDTTATEAIAKMAGFQPATVARVQEATATVQRAISLNKTVEAEIADQWAQGLYEKDADKVAAARERLRDWNAANEDMPIKITFQQVRKRLQAMNQDKATRMEKTAPKEIRREMRRELAEAGR